MKTATIRENTLIVAAAVLLTVIGYAYFGNVSETASLLFVVMTTLFAAGLLLFEQTKYWVLAIALLPLSMDLELGAGARINFPSEALLVILLPVVLLFNGEFRGSLRALFLHPIGMLLCADVFIELLTGLFGTHPDVSMKRILVRAVFIVLFFGGAHYFLNRAKGVYLWLAYAIGLIPVMYFTIRNHIRVDFDPRAVFSISQPHYNDHTVYGACLAFMISVLLVLLIKWRIFFKQPIWFWGLVAVTGLLLFSEVFALSRAALLSLVVAGVFALLLWLKIRFRTIVIALLMGGGLVFFYSDSIYNSIHENEAVSNDGELTNHFSSITNVNTDASNLERINRWVCAWRMFEERPILGFGPGTYQFEYNRFQTLDYKTYISTNTGDRGNAHSEYLTYLSETGIVGFLVFLILVFGSVYLGMKNHYGVSDPLLKTLNLMALLGLVTFYFHGLFNSFLDQGKMAFLVYSALGTIAAVQLIDARQKQQRT